MLKSVFRFLPACALAMTATQAAHATVPPGVKLAADQTLVRHYGSEAASLDPAMDESVQDTFVDTDLYEGLTRSDAAGQVQPGVAMRWERTDPTTWIFHLRHDAKWSNGAPVTAGDFIYAWQREVDPKTASIYTILIDFFQNAAQILDGKMPPTKLGAHAIDPYTIEIKTTAPIPFMPQMLSNPVLAPEYRPAIEKWGVEWTKPGHLIGNGPFVLESWIPNDHIVVVKNPYYWDARNVTLTKVVWVPIDNNDTAVKQYESGQLDMTYELPPGSYRYLKARYGDQVHIAPESANYFFALNVTDPVMKDVRVRKALDMVIDRDTLVKRILGDGEIPTTDMMPWHVAGANVVQRDWAAWPMDKRVAVARQLLAEAGYNAQHPLQVTYSYNTTDINKLVGLYVLSEWRNKLGVQGKLENQEWKVFATTRHNGNYQIARSGWSADYNDATSYLDLVRCGTDANDLQYCSKKVDALIAAGNAETDDAKRTALMTEADQAAMDDYPMIPLYQRVTARLVRPYVGGYTDLDPMDREPSQDLYIIQH
jgi:oligopeptide transport system substrate-binding protein